MPGKDSDVLAIESDGRILCRANDSIYLAKIDGTQIREATLIVKDADVPELHWAFSAPAAIQGSSKLTLVLCLSAIVRQASSKSIRR